MQILEHGQDHKRTLLFFPCTAEPVWAFADTVAQLSQSWRVFQVVYDGHQPEYPGDFTSVEQTVDAVISYLKSCGISQLDGAYVTVQSCKNQFYSDLVTPLPDKINVPGTEIHIFYALKMGEKYRERYERHFANPAIHEQDLQHEELLACYPECWVQLVKDIMEGKQ